MANQSLGGFRPESQSRFWSKVDRRTPLECWPWKLTVNRDGYATTTLDGERYHATHVALILDGRPQPYPEAVACHRCDNPSCINPSHLWWGSRKENSQDAAKKGRWSRPLGGRITRHHINLMVCPDDRLPIEAARWKVPVDFLTELRARLIVRQPRIGDPLDGLPHIRRGFF